MRPLLIVAAVLAFAALVSSAQAQQWRETRPGRYAAIWCLTQAEFGNSQCTFTSRRQCEASRAGLNDACTMAARGAPTGGFRRF